MKGTQRTAVGAMGRAVIMLGSTAGGIVLYQLAQDIGGKAYDHYFPTLAEVPTPQDDFFFFTYLLLLPALLAALAVGVPALILRLRPRIIVLWCVGVAVMAVSTRFGYDPWSGPIVYLMSLLPIVLLAWLLARWRNASVAGGERWAAVDLRRNGTGKPTIL